MNIQYEPKKKKKNFKIQRTLYKFLCRAAIITKFSTGYRTIDCSIYGGTYYLQYNMTQYYIL